jgi:uncharacterized membrane protein
MDTTTFLLVISSAVFHALWNFYAKRSTGDKVIVLALAYISAGVIGAFLAIWLISAMPPLWPWLGLVMVSGACLAGMIWTLGLAYNMGEISTVYPISRGLGGAVVAVMLTASGVESMSLTGVLGVVAIIVGMLVIGLANRHPDLRKAFALSIICGLALGVCSITDSIGIRHAPPLLHLALTNSCAAMILVPLMAYQYRPQLHFVLRTRLGEAIAIGMAQMLTYLMVLYAFLLSTVSYVAVLRESSIVMATILGVWLLKEQLTLPKAIGLGLILTGAILIHAA